MRIIGLDPGLRRTGWGVVTLSRGRLAYAACGAVTTDAEAPLAERLATLHRGLIELLEAERPDVAAVEETFVNKDARATLKLGQARGAVLLAPAMRGLPVAEYAPNQVKKAVVGVGHADKSQIQHMVRRLLPGAAPGTADAADALAVAICHALIAPTLDRIAAAAAGPGPGKPGRSAAG